MLKSLLRKFYDRHHDLVNRYGISVSQITADIFHLSSFTHSWLITEFVTRKTRWVPLVEEELHTLPEHMSSSPVFNGARVSQSLVFCVVFCRSLFVLLFFFYWSCCCLSSIYGFRLRLWYLQALLIRNFILKLV
jgi:hypothetical protein